VQGTSGRRDNLTEEVLAKLEQVEEERKEIDRELDEILKKLRFEA
jgi:uncharacterized protein (UPF0335 family)